MDELDRYNGRPVDVPKWLQNSFGSQDDRFTIDALRGARVTGDRFRACSLWSIIDSRDCVRDI